MAMQHTDDSENGILFLHENGPEPARPPQTSDQFEPTSMNGSAQMAASSEAVADAPSTPLNAVILGQRLKEARERRGLEVTDIACTLNFNCDVVQSIEAGALNRLPTSYEVGFFRTYAQYMGDQALGVSLCEAVDVVRDEYKPSTQPEPLIVAEDDETNWLAIALRSALALALVAGAIVWFTWSQGHAGQDASTAEEGADIPYRYSLSYNDLH